MLDEEWENFINNDNDNDNDYDNDNNNYNDNNSNILFEKNANTNIDIDRTENIEIIRLNNIPKCGDIYISTKTKIVYLNIPFDIYNIYWKIPIIDYNEAKEGIIKKQIKISSTNQKEIDEINKKLLNIPLYDNKIIVHIDNPDGRVKFKDIRKISIGINSKDLLFSRIKDKSAFYNCFVITLRVFINNTFKEVHIKVFNTGKLEIPGLQNDEILYLVLNKLINILQPLVDKPIIYDKSKTDIILINSNFNCGFYIDREKLFNILRYKYHINACYDPCSYPGIQCVYYYDIKNNTRIDTVNKSDTIIKISFMIFRTGSILIVGKCDEDVLNIVYEYIKKILYDEYFNICIKNIDTNYNQTKPKIKKIKKKTIYIT